MSLFIAGLPKQETKGPRLLDVKTGDLFMLNGILFMRVDADDSLLSKACDTMLTGNGVSRCALALNMIDGNIGVMSLQATVDAVSATMQVHVE